MSAVSITVTDLRLHVVTEKKEIEAARLTAGIERELRHQTMFSIASLMSSSPQPPSDTRMKDAEDEGAVNTGSNLFVTRIHPRLSESDVSRLFDQYGQLES